MRWVPISFGRVAQISETVEQLVEAVANLEYFLFRTCEEQKIVDVSLLLSMVFF
jgi:hypothetical protein